MTDKKPVSRALPVTVIAGKEVELLLDSHEAVYGQAMPASKREANGKVVQDGPHPRQDECLKADFSYWELLGVCPKE